MQASLPKDLEQRYVKDIKEGETAATAPWAMWADNTGKLWLKTYFPITKDIGDSSSLLITRKDGQWVCNTSNCMDYRWMKEAYTPIYRSEPVSEIKFRELG